MSLTKIAALTNHVIDGDIKAIIAGRVCQCDADGAIYDVAHPSERLEANFKMLLKRLEHLRCQSGSQWLMSHITMELKGGRTEIAHYGKYQNKRHVHRTEGMAERVKSLRQKLAVYQSDTIFPAPQYFIEADDSMVTAHEERIKQYGFESSIIATNDKDMNMATGYVMNLRTYEITSLTDGTFGHIKYYKKPSKQGKVIGRGTKFFWAQMLYGDAADTIAGVPLLAGVLVDKYNPMKRPTRAIRRDSTVGPSLAVDILSGTTNDKSAYNRVKQCYMGYWGSHWKFFLFEMAFLLWMKRSNDVCDVLPFLQSCGFEYELHSHQVEALRLYGQRCQEIANGVHIQNG